jgi:uncharacterized protein YdaT
MSNPSPRHVVHHNEEWAVRVAGSNRVSSTHSTQQEAIARAREQAIAERGQVLIHGRNGQIREERTYRADPFPPRG